MSRKNLGCSFLLQIGLALIASGPALAQHQHGSGRLVQFGAHAVGVLTHASPAVLNERLTEVYVTQPMLYATSSVGAGRLSFSGILNLEGLTLERGELNHGVWGEGYIDRRHPHTYLHEAVLTARESMLGVEVSLSAGRGFVPFGTDDPMVRPFVKYPSNHHLAQILERWVAIAAIRRTPVMFELGTFNGDEPTGPKSTGHLDRFGDSWAARATIAPVASVELQTSFAKVESPEQAPGGGLDQNKRSVSARVELPVRGARVYGLLEHARTADLHSDVEVFVFTSFLGELSAQVRGWVFSGRYENTTRPEEERTFSLFRSVRPTTDNSILGRSRWRVWSAGVARPMQVGVGTATVFAELQRAFTKPVDPFPVIEPKAFYGDDHMWNLSFGLRLAAGMKHSRMGRYGAAAN